MKQRLLVIGNGMAGMQMVESLLQRAPQRLRHHGHWPRAARQLQPRAAVAGAGR